MQSCHQDGGSSFQYDSGQLHDQVCCQAPHLRGACPALANEGGSRKREILARRGSRTRRGGTVMPLRDYLFKTMLRFLMFSAFTFTFSAM